MSETEETCIFCRIALGHSPAQIEYQDNDVVVIWDIEPNAPTHLLVISKKHIASVTALQDEDKPLVANMIMVAKEMAKRKGLETNGYRLVFNTGADAGQVVDHIHLHLLGGTHLGPMTDAKREMIT